jgi:hypothetical protein
MIIKEDRDAAAPISKAIANETDNHIGFDNEKKSITCIVEIILTTAYRLTNVVMINQCISLFCCFT